MKYLLDTDTCIGIIRGRAPKTLARVRGLIGGEAVVCSIVRFELLFGVEHCGRRAQEERKLDEFLREFESLAFDDRCAGHAAVVREDLESRGMRIGPYDTLIAGLAKAHQLTLVTRNL